MRIIAGKWAGRNLVSPSGRVRPTSEELRGACMDLLDYARVFDRDAIPFVEKITQIGYDIAFVDPPYGSRKLDRVVSRWLAQPFSRILALEHEPGHKLHVRGKSVRAGDSVFTIIRSAG